MKNTILVPLDGSPLAEQALPHAVALARKTGSELLLLSAVQPLETWMEAAGAFPTGTNWEEESRAAADYLSSQRENLQTQGIEARMIVMWGKAADCIRRAAATPGIDLITLTTHGRSGLPRLVLGSVASEVVRTASQPVLLVKATEQPTAQGEISRVLIPVDGSPMSESVIPVAEELARKLSAEIVLLRVITPPVVVYPGQAVPSARPVLEDIEAAANDHLDRLAVAVRHEGFKVDHEVVLGEATDAILEAADRYGVDLIAMSSHGRTGLSRLLMGSTADGVVRNSTRPVLIVRPQEIVKTQLPQEAAGIEIIEGVSVAPTLVPPPTVSEFAVPAEANGIRKTPAQAHRPERRALQ
jgi:nucleotide-binding universal stress UspA family protein